MEKAREKESLQLASGTIGGGKYPPRVPYGLPYFPYLPTFSRPGTVTSLSRYLSLTLFLSLPVCMVKYCIIVLTAGRKTAQPVVPARRVARIRAACTLQSRPRPECREVSRRNRASPVAFVAVERLSSSSLPPVNARVETGCRVHPLYFPPSVTHREVYIARRHLLFSALLVHAATIRSAFRVSSPFPSCALHPRQPYHDDVHPYTVDNDYGATSRPSCVSRALARPLFSG